jgi:hypothetical protein
MAISESRRLTLLTLATVFACVCGCDKLTMIANHDLEFSYLGDGQGGADRASVSSRTRVIASARRVAVRSTSDPAVTEIDVDETHFVRGTLTVVYTGRIVFRCRQDEEWCRRVREVPVSGTRPRDVFRKWPLTMSAPMRGFPL